MQGEVPVLSVGDFAALRAGPEAYALLDVREPWEVALGALPEAMTIPMNDAARSRSDRCRRIGRWWCFATTASAAVRSPHGSSGSVTTMRSTWKAASTLGLARSIPPCRPTERSGP